MTEQSMGSDINGGRKAFSFKPYPDPKSKKEHCGSTGGLEIMTSVNKN